MAYLPQIVVGSDRTRRNGCFQIRSHGRADDGRLSRAEKTDFMNVTKDCKESLVVVILDPTFGENLRTIPAGQPVWITMSPANEPVIRSLWSTGQSPTNHLTGITGFHFDEGVSAEDRLLAELDTIDLHHGPYSSPAPYTEIAVRGARLTSDVRSGLWEYGFSDFTETEDGFTARRTPEEAARLRE